jgi:hypothetical protein
MIWTVIENRPMIGSDFGAEFMKGKTGIAHTPPAIRIPSSEIALGKVGLGTWKSGFQS